MAYMKYLLEWLQDCRRVYKQRRRLKSLLALSGQNKEALIVRLFHVRCGSLEYKRPRTPASFYAAAKLTASYIEAAKDRAARRAQSNKDQYNYRFNQLGANICSVKLPKE